MAKYRVKFQLFNKIVSVEVEANTELGAIASAELEIKKFLKVVNVADIVEPRILKKSERLENFYLINPHLRPAYVKTPSV